MFILLLKVQLSVQLFLTNTLSVAINSFPADYFF